VLFGRNRESRTREAAGRRNLARSSAQENGQQKMEGCLSNPEGIVLEANYESRAQAKKVPKSLSPFETQLEGAPKTESREIGSSRSDRME
jgi:hypothetical protein